MPLSDCEARDPRIRRTRQLLQGALRNLMQRRNFDEISVQDIADEATVNRATFYDHYNDKYALLAALVGGDFHRLLYERSVCYDEACSTTASSLILAVCDYMTLSGATGACERQSAFEPLIEAAMVGAIRRVLEQGAPQKGVSPQSPFAMALAAASWAIFGAAREWYRSANRRPAEEVVPEILELVLPLLRSTSTADAAAPR